MLNSIIFLCFHFTVVESQRFLRAPRSLAALQGSQVQLPCRVDLNSDYLEWLEYATSTRGERIFLSFMNNADKSINREHPKHDKYRVYGSYDLVIKDLTFDDAGIYRCRLMLAGVYRDAEIVVVSEYR